MNIRVSEEYEVGKTLDMRYRFWKIQFETEPEATTFFCDDRSDLFEKWDDIDDDCIILTTKDSKYTWAEAKSKLFAVLKEVFGPTTNIEFVEKRWDSVPEQEVTIITTGRGYLLRAKFLKNILLEQAVALEEELAPEGYIENGIENAEVKLTGLRCWTESGKIATDVVPSVITALRKVLGQNIKITGSVIRGLASPKRRQP